MSRRITKIRITGQIGPHRKTLAFVVALKYVESVKLQLRIQGYTKLWTKVERK